MPKDSIFALNHIMYGIFMIILLNIAGMFMFFVDIMPWNIVLTMSIGFPICLVLFAFFHGFKNNIGFKSYIVVSLILWIVLSLLKQYLVLWFVSVTPAVVIRNLGSYIFRKGIIQEYYQSYFSTHNAGNLIVNIVYLGIMFLSYQGGYIVSKTLKGKPKLPNSRGQMNVHES